MHGESRILLGPAQGLRFAPSPQELEVPGGSCFPPLIPEGLGCSFLCLWGWVAAAQGPGENTWDAPSDTPQAGPYPGAPQAPRSLITLIN